MGTYINIGNAGFQRTRNSEYVDKSGLIAVVNRTLFTEQCYTCVSRCRRFGKSVAAKMLYAYYDHSCDSRHLFEDLAIARDPSFEKHLNKYPVIFLDMTNFMKRKDDSVVEKIDAELLADVSKAYPDIPTEAADSLMEYLLRVCGLNGERFIFIIDEWDAICREFKTGTQAMDDYIDLAHDENTSILSYNDENSLACVLSIAYYAARDNYIIHREFASGKAAIKREQSQACLNSAEREQARTKSKGFADLVLIPRKNVDSPAVIIELKYNHNADAAIDQIRRKEYSAKTGQYADRLLLVGINYNRETKQHECKIIKE